MVRVLLVTIAVLIALALLLAIFAGSAQAKAAAPVAVDDAGQAGQMDGKALICLTLVGGTALLAGAVWVGMLRRIPA